MPTVFYGFDLSNSALSQRIQNDLLTIQSLKNTYRVTLLNKETFAATYFFLLHLHQLNARSIEGSSEQLFVNSAFRFFEKLRRKDGVITNKLENNLQRLISHVGALIADQSSNGSVSYRQITCG